MSHLTRAHFDEALRYLDLVHRWDRLSDSEKGAERAKGAGSEFREVTASPELGRDGFEVAP